MSPLLFLALAVAAPKLKDKAPPAPPIVGEWVAESRTIRGQPLPLPANGVELIFRADGGYTWRIGGEDPDPDGHKYTVNQKSDPAEVDFIPRAKPQYLGLFKVEGDTLTLCFSRAGNPRPTKLEAPAGVNAELYVFKRLAKK